MSRIALVGDYSESITAHRAIPIALELAAKHARADVSWEWRHSRSLAGATTDSLSPYAGIWCVPGSPYENTRGVLDAIRFARETGRPFLGTCGGFQHALIEYAESVWRIAAAHAEIDPAALDPVIAPLAGAPEATVRSRSWDTNGARSRTRGKSGSRAKKNTPMRSPSGKHQT